MGVRKILPADNALGTVQILCNSFLVYFVLKLTKLNRFDIGGNNFVREEHKRIIMIIAILSREWGTWEPLKRWGYSA